MHLRPVVLSVVLMLLVACRDQTPALGPYVTGSNLNEITSKIGEAFADVPRPQAGWDPSKDEVEQVHRSSKHFETATGKTVLRTRVYYVPRSSSGLGMYWDYLFFDANDLVIGSYRRHVD